MNDARFLWLVLVPRQVELVEISDLPLRGQRLLWRETQLAVQALRQCAPCDKLNLGVLGNRVQQLHVHVVARNTGDAAWPGPVWGHGQAVAYPPAQLEQSIAALQAAFGVVG